MLALHVDALRSHASRVAAKKKHKLAWRNRVPLVIEVVKALFITGVSWGFQGGRNAKWLFSCVVLLRVGCFLSIASS